MYSLVNLLDGRFTTISLHPLWDFYFESAVVQWKAPSFVKAVASRDPELLAQVSKDAPSRFISPAFAPPLPPLFPQTARGPLPHNRTAYPPT
jgi:hypothetical protein